jgi:hypothetical protein
MATVKKMKKAQYGMSKDMSMMKMGGKAKKMADGGKAKSFPDLNKDGKITKADILKGRGVIAKNGAGMHKMPNGKMMKNSEMKMGGKMAQQAAIAIAMKKEGKTPKKKMQYGGSAASMVPKGKKMMNYGGMMKRGGMMKKGC